MAQIIFNTIIATLIFSAFFISRFSNGQLTNDFGSQLMSLQDFGDDYNNAIFADIDGDNENSYESMAKRAPLDRSALVRFGKRAPLDRSALVRFGKRAPLDRAAMVRFGKRAPLDRAAMVRFGKRAPFDRSSMVRFGKRK
ncbi:unnamed protein product [Meloidogyne enterolobii]|uniref:Uncharacterized protein n=3 Tax=Meloidogyne enterolobii TaxID=390850 RepID=A0A6V7X9U6_MELEN|nr:unnamed protein product [Meloidogyne enterolobii]